MYQTKWWSCNQLGFLAHQRLFKEKDKVRGKYAIFSAPPLAHHPWTRTSQSLCCTLFVLAAGWHVSLASLHVGPALIYRNGQKKYSNVQGSTSLLLSSAWIKHSMLSANPHSNHSLSRHWSPRFSSSIGAVIWAAVSFKCTAIIFTACISFFENTPLPRLYFLAVAV